MPPTSVRNGVARVATAVSQLEPVHLLAVCVMLLAFGMIFTGLAIGSLAEQVDIVSSRQRRHEGSGYAPGYSAAYPGLGSWPTIVVVREAPDGQPRPPA